MPAQIKENDPRIETENVSFQGASGKVNAYLVRPKGVKKAPGVVIIHENKGLQPHIKDVARRARGLRRAGPRFHDPGRRDSGGRGQGA